MRKVALAVAVALALPGVARAGLVTMVERDVPLGPRALATVAPAAPARFDMLGLHWRGTGSVAFRTRSSAGRWSAWQAADADAGGPVPRGWRDGNLVWVGASDAVRFRTTGTVTRLRAYYLRSRTTTRATRTLAVAGAPPIVSRAGWEADEKIKRAAPRYAPALKLAIVHHTAGSNSYTPAQAAAIVRGIEIYHVQANGWNDIGYNFLIDRYGTVYEGRAGGIERNVIGAHALGFNTGSAGVALIGNFQSTTPPPAMIDSLVRLLSWRLDIAHVDPLSTVADTSAGNPEFRAGRVVILPAISGHRDTGPTECPGNVAYEMLPAIRQRVSKTGLPKLYSPYVTGVLGGTVRFQARLSSMLPWTVTVASPSGAVVARRSGRGTIVDWSWSSAGTGPGPYRWTIAAGAARPATGTLGSTPLPPVVTPAPTPPAPKPVTPTPKPVPVPIPVPVPSTLLTGLSAAPAVVSPGTDPSSAYVTVDFTLAAAATVTARLTGGATPITLFSASVPAGDSTFSWSLASVPDGQYTLEVAAKPTSGATATQTLQLTVYRTLSGYAVAPALVSPNGDGVNDNAVVSFTLARAVPVQVLIERTGVPVATAFSGTLGPGAQSVVWNGTSGGVRLPDGTYDVVTVVTDTTGTLSFTAPLTVDTTPPSLVLLDAPSLRFQLSEPATVTVVVNGQQTTIAEPAGMFNVPFAGGAVTAVSAYATDAAGNTSATVTGP
jgi:hypothetical protein